MSPAPKIAGMALLRGQSDRGTASQCEGACRAPLVDADLNVSTRSDVGDWLTCISRCEVVHEARNRVRSHLELHLAGGARLFGKILGAEICDQVAEAVDPQH